jgi:hypothetical protein
MASVCIRLLKRVSSYASWAILELDLVTQVTSSEEDLLFLSLFNDAS